MGDLPPPGEWTRLEVPAGSANLKPGSKINGWAFTQFDGTVSYDQAGTINAYQPRRKSPNPHAGDFLELLTAAIV